MKALRSQIPMMALALALGAAAMALLLALNVHGVGDGPSCTPGDRALRRIELVFGLSRKGRADIGETEWSDFVAREVTPRFQDGMTILSANGQWRNAAGEIVREPARIVLIWAAPAPDLHNRVEHIRLAWRREHRQESVLRAYGTDCVSF